ncbi:MAG TPA: AAA family ATPase, partial [Candidatus Udaeobacter sp.]|nr:AAA family ATPase [Candidatus Udaeobacter sp.]
MPVILDAPRLGLEHPRFVGWGRKAWVDGEAILARDRLSGLPVAWSSFPKTSAGGWRSFTDLAPSLGRDLHPGLARLIGYGREERSAWIAEEWIPGTTSLADRERAASLASRDLRGLLLQFAAALAALHAAGLVHGRLTPAHLRFTRAAGRLGHGWIVGAGTAWLGHPGSSRALDEAPELAAGEVPTPRSDVYALGATFLAALASPIDEPWRAFLDRLAQADPADRPADGQAVIQLARAIPRRIAARGARASAGEQAESGVTPAPVGRAPEHLLALAWLERARRGEVHALEVRGPSGSGKSTFLAAVAAAARRRGFEVLALDLRPGSTSDPEATVLEALERALGGGSAFASALATLPPTALPEQRCALLATRLGEALDRTGARLCLVVDPIAGSDQEGLPLLRYLAGEIGPRPFLVLAGTIAPGQFPLAEVIELPPLDLRATGQLLARLLAEGSVPPDLGPVLHAAAGGHPLAMRLALAGWLAEGRLAIGSEAWIERPTAVRSTGERDPIVSAALARLDPRSRAAAELLAIWNGA